jgi:dDENN domain
VCVCVRARAQTMHSYVSGLLSDIDRHTITDVQNSERVSLLLKDSFIESFAPQERPFVRLFVETQLFAEYIDSRLI